MISKLLVANRGEIALRILRSCKEMGIATVAVYSEGDSESLHLDLADESVCIGPAVSAKSYLNIEAIIKAAKETGADAIHPGYGYLAENDRFAEACADEGIIFIGPTPQCMRDAGDKITAKRKMEQAGVPIIPSSPGSIADLEKADEFCSSIGYPVMIKASGGGGGRGIKVCRNENVLHEEFPIAKMEAGAAFGNDELYIEKFIEDPRHIEFQILADSKGNVAHLGERECSIQRRFQKLIEESPSPALDDELRRKMGDAAIAACKAVNYLNAGTVEFLLDSDNNFFFIEINSRIQVEHPVTEMTTGIDLVKEQIRIANGEEIGYSFDDIGKKGWAIECRINAEDSERNFLPCPGKIEKFRVPGGFGVRVDSHLYEGYELPIYYDSLISKLISFGPDRKSAIDTMLRALGEYCVEPLKTTIPLFQKVMRDRDFIEGKFHTGYLVKFVPDDDDDDDDEDTED